MTEKKGAEKWDEVSASKRKEFPQIYAYYDEYMKLFRGKINTAEPMSPKLMEAVLQVVFVAGFKDGLDYVKKRGKKV